MMTNDSNENIYDIAVAGTGPGGLTAAIYSARYKLKTIVFGKEFGGQIGKAHRIENWPSYNVITGTELMQKTETQVKGLGVEILYDPIKKVSKEGKLFKIETEGEKEYMSKKVIYTIGTEHRHLGVPGEEQFSGRGVSFCATCDGPFFVDKTVGVIGGSDAALSAAALLADYAKKVYIIYRKDRFFRAEPTWVEVIKGYANIEPIFNENVTEILGDMMVNKIKLSSGKDLELDGVFVEIGSDPKVETIKELDIKTTEQGYIITDSEQRTNIQGLFAAGDITNHSLKQAITAAGQGATAAYSAYNEILKSKEN